MRGELTGQTSMTQEGEHTTHQTPNGFETTAGQGSSSSSSAVPPSRNRAALCFEIVIIICILIIVVMTLINIYVLDYYGYIEYKYISKIASGDTCVSVTTTSGILGVHQVVKIYNFSNFTGGSMSDDEYSWQKIEKTDDINSNVSVSNNNVLTIICGSLLIVVGCILCILIILRNIYHYKYKLCNSKIGQKYVLVIVLFVFFGVYIASHVILYQSMDDWNNNYKTETIENNFEIFNSFTGCTMFSSTFNVQDFGLQTTLAPLFISFVLSFFVILCTFKSYPKVQVIAV